MPSHFVSSEPENGTVPSHIICRHQQGQGIEGRSMLPRAIFQNVSLFL